MVTYELEIEGRSLFVADCNNDINSGSSKNATAKKLGIPIITEEQLIAMF